MGLPGKPGTTVIQFDPNTSSYAFAGIDEEGETA
jgi:hypothetical protein